MKYVYCLTHNKKVEPDGDGWICDTKSLGYFSTRAKAKKAIQFYKTVIGFKDHPDDFCISEYKLNEMFWTEGFVPFGE